MDLIAIDASRADPALRARLWGAVLDLACEAEAAAFTVDATLAAKADAGAKELVEQVLAQPADARGLRSLATPELVAAVGPHVLAVNLYSREGWVAGVSDWGDRLSALLPGGLSARLRAQLDATATAYDVAEADDRPPPPE